MEDHIRAVHCLLKDRIPKMVTWSIRVGTQVGTSWYVLLVCPLLDEEQRH